MVRRLREGLPEIVLGQFPILTAIKVVAEIVEQIGIVRRKIDRLVIFSQRTRVIALLVVEDGLAAGVSFGYVCWIFGVLTAADREISVFPGRISDL